jgi:hypothetical protein
VANSERVLGSEHPDTLVSIENLASCYELQGIVALKHGELHFLCVWLFLSDKSGDAEALYIVTFQQRQRTLGRGHYLTIKTKTHIADLWKKRCKDLSKDKDKDANFKFAELHNKSTTGAAGATATVSQVPSAPTSAVATEPATVNPLSVGTGGTLNSDFTDRNSVNNNAFPQSANTNNQSSAAADPVPPANTNPVDHRNLLQQTALLYQECLEDSEKLYGFNHLDTLYRANRLAQVWYAQGKDSVAEPLMVRSLAACEQILGVTHPETLVALNNLASMYQAQNKHNQAEKLLVKCLHAREACLGGDHADTQRTMMNISRIYVLQHKYDDALLMLTRLLGIRERLLGKQNDKTVLTAISLEEVKLMKQKYQDQCTIM